MKYSKPIYNELGDLYIGVEYGDTSEIYLSFLVNALNDAVLKRNFNGIIETVTSVRTLAIVYNPNIIRKDVLLQELYEIQSTGELESLTELPSRIIRIPIWFNDPWSDECAKAHGVENNLEYLSNLNDVSIEELICMYTGTQYWVAGTAFLIGTFGALPLDAGRITLDVPKWRSPRKWTYERTLTAAGDSLALFSIKAAGGFQMIGRTPIEIYDPMQKNPIFKNDPALVKPTDRIEYYEISEKEYYKIRREVENGTYKYEIEDGVLGLEQIQKMP
jgi:allophanate hydrolase subunit 1